MLQRCPSRVNSLPHPVNALINLAQYLMSIDFSLLGSALKERREALGIPRAEIARRVGVTATYIWLVEGARPRKSGQPSRPTQAVLERWARALGMDDRYARQLLIMAGYV